VEHSEEERRRWEVRRRELCRRRRVFFVSAGLCACWVKIRFYSRLTVEFTVMVQAYNGAGFGWYFTKGNTFSAIFLKSGSFNGTEPIFP
jgi:hypothetical protein